MEKHSDIDYKLLAEGLGIKGRATGINMYCRCPLHKDRNPSFSLNVISGVWICFGGCGQGNFRELVQKMLDCTARDAESWINHNATTLDFPSMQKLIEEQLDTDNKVDTAPKDWQVRYAGLDSNVMPIWFLQRGFSWTTIREWGIRWDPIAEQVVIPVYDMEDQMAGTVSRNVREGAQPKYLNSFGLLHRAILFGLPQVVGDSIIIVEGPLDAIWLQQNEFPGVALLGTSLSQEQISLLQRRQIREITLALDNDASGQFARERHLTRLHKAGWLYSQIYQIEYPEGRKDVQECSKVELAIMFANRKSGLF